MAVVFARAMRGEFNNMLCIVTMTTGAVASLTGIVMAIAYGNSFPLILYIAVLIFSFFIKKMAMRFVVLYEEKQRARLERLNEIRLGRGRETGEEPQPYYTEETFDDPELRFGKGGYTDNKL